MQRLNDSQKSSNSDKRSPKFKMIHKSIGLYNFSAIANKICLKSRNMIDFHCQKKNLGQIK